MPIWDSSDVKAHLKLTIQQIAQLHDKQVSTAQITSSDVATLLQQGNVSLARAKARNLFQHDVSGELMEGLVMHLRCVLAHYSEIERGANPSPAFIEAAASIILAAPYTGSKDLLIVRDVLVQQLGPEFAQSVAGNRDNLVSPRIVRALSAPSLSAVQLNDYMSNIARSHGVKWVREPTRQEKVNVLSEILDPIAAPTVDLLQLRKLCSQGLPDDPPWLRPRIWKLLFGILPDLKSSWEIEMRKQRDSYYDLIRRLLKPISNLPAPSAPLTAQDASLLKLSKQLGGLPRSLFTGLEQVPEACDQCPLDLTAPDDFRIDFANALDARLHLIRSGDTAEHVSLRTPEIRVEPDYGTVPGISLSSPDEGSTDASGSSAPGSPQKRRSATSTSLLPPMAFNAGGSHHKHASALLRLLYVHSCLNPLNRSPHLPTLLVPLYSVLIREIEPQDVPHVEADTFWLFEAVVGEFSELEDEEGGCLWMARLSERLAWADEELYHNLVAKGLDPRLPHYSYRWLASLLTQSLPLSSVIPVWDTLFACPMRTRDSNPKLDHLIDVCTTMLMRARTPLYNLGKSNVKPSSLWSAETPTSPTSPMRAWELGDAFAQGIAFLQRYPVDTAGGIDNILQEAMDMLLEREEQAKANRSGGLGLGARLKASVWKGITSLASEEHEGEWEDSTTRSDTAEPPQSPTGPGLGSRLANTVWKGITNQSAMEVPPSPSDFRSPPVSPMPPSPLRTVAPEQSPSPQSSPVLTAPTRLWSYAEKLKESDAVANLSKVSTNWRAKAMAGRWGVGTSSKLLSGFSRTGAAANESLSVASVRNFTDGQRHSMPEMPQDTSNSSPRRPTFGTLPRDAMWSSIRSNPSSSPPESPGASYQSDTGLLNKAKMAALAGLQGRSSPDRPKHGPRPLILNTSSVMTPMPSRRPGLPTGQSPQTVSPIQWAEVLQMKEQTGRRSSVTSASTSTTPSRRRSPQPGNHSDKDTGSKIVPLHGRTVSPMAPSFRTHQDRSSVGSSSTASESVTPSQARPSSSLVVPESAVPQGWSRIDLPDSPSPPGPATPAVFGQDNHTVQVKDAEPSQDSLVLADFELVPPLQSRKLMRKKTPPPVLRKVEDASDSVIGGKLMRNRPRSKRHMQRPAVLKVREHPKHEQAVNPSALVAWPDEQDLSPTPKAADFGTDGSTLARSARRLRKASGDDQTAGQRPGPGDGQEGRGRKISGGEAVVSRRQRDSAAEEGDDEGYDELLSAYESEEGQKNFAAAQAASSSEGP